MYSSIYIKVDGEFVQNSLFKYQDGDFLNFWTEEIYSTGSDSTVSPVPSASLIAWYDASDLYSGSNPSPDTIISSWSDISGNGYDLDVVYGSNSTFKTSGPNSKNYVSFPNKIDGFRTTKSFGASEMFGPDRDSLDWFAVIRFVSDVVFFKWEYNTGYNRCGCEGTNRWDFPNDSSGQTNGWSDTLDGSWQILQLSCDGTNKYVYLDGVQVATDSLPAAMGNYSSSFFLGTNNNNQSSLGAVVDFAEVILFNERQSLEQQGNITSYLGEKYGISTPFTSSL